MEMMWRRVLMVMRVVEDNAGSGFSMRVGSGVEG